MDLELASGRKVRNATMDDLREHLEGEEFAVLSVAPEIYMQCAICEETPGTYLLEYRDGSEDQHFQVANSPVPLEIVLAAFSAYLKDDPSWRSDIAWEPLKLS